MDWKKTIRVLFILIFLKADVHGKEETNHDMNDTADSVDDSEMIKMLTEQNNKLVDQNEQLEKVWTALTGMCNALEMSTCDCEEPQPSGSPTTSATESIYLRPTAFPTGAAYFVFYADVHGKEETNHDMNDAADSVDDSREMLKMLKEQNKKLVARNEQLQKVWTALSGMCNALGLSTCDCEEPQPPSPSTTSATESIYLRPTGVPIGVKEISYAEDDSQSSVTVVYMAGRDHLSRWHGVYKNGARYITVGEIYEVPESENLFSSTINIEQFENLWTLYFRLDNDVESMSLFINTTAFDKDKTTPVDVATVLFDVMPSYNVPENGDLDIKFKIDERLVEENNIESTEAIFVGVNLSSSEVFEIGNEFSDFISINGTGFPNSSVIIKRSVLESGGQLMLGYQQISPATTIKQLNYFLFAKVIPLEANEMLVYDTLGIHNLTELTYIKAPFTSVLCLAMGNPSPMLSMYKLDGHGNAEVIETETYISRRFTVATSLALSPKQPTKAEGKYVCSVSNGIRTVNTTTQAIVYRPVVFNDSDTRAVQKADYFIVTCSATGMPVPHLTFRLFHRDGPDLENTVEYERQTDTKSEQLVFRIPVIDGDDFHTVVCLALQVDVRMEYTREIVLKPEVDSN